MNPEERMFLSDDEVIFMTGYKSRACQKSWCAKNGVRFMVRPDGSLVISKRHLEECLGASVPKQIVQQEPDFSSLL